MFGLAENDAYDAECAGESARQASPSPRLVAVPVPGVQPDRYGQRRGPNMPAIVIILLVHAVIIGALIQVRYHVIRRSEAKLAVMNLTPPPPPPPASAEPPPPTQPKVVSPPPLVQVPAPPMQIVTTPDPQPRPTPVAIQVKAAPAGPPAPPSTVQSSDLSTQMISGKPPRYPIESRRKREQGTVLLSLTLGLDGGVSAVSIAQSSGFSRLDDAARDAVRKWRWAPTYRNGQPVYVRGVVEIPFVLQG